MEVIRNRMLSQFSSLLNTVSGRQRIPGGNPLGILRFRKIGVLRAGVRSCLQPGFCPDCDLCVRGGSG